MFMKIVITEKLFEKGVIIKFKDTTTTTIKGKVSSITHRRFGCEGAQENRKKTSTNNDSRILMN